MTSAEHPATSAASTSSCATLRKEMWSRSTAIEGQTSRPSAPAPPVVPTASSSSAVGSLAAHRLAPRNARELTELLQGVDAMLESEPMQSEIPRAPRRCTGAKPSPRSASVVGQRQTRPLPRQSGRARGHRHASRGRPSSAAQGSPSLRATRPGAAHARRRTPRSRAAAAGVHVERQRGGCGVASDLDQPVPRHARTEWVQAPREACFPPAARHLRGTRPAIPGGSASRPPRPYAVEQHELDASSLRRLAGCESLVVAEV